MVITVAMDTAGADAARPWIEAAKPTYPCLIDRDHRVAELYGMVNVPQAVWIDEAGGIVRPTESAGAYEGFRKMNRSTKEMPADAAKLNADARATYLAAICDWVERGAKSEHALNAAAARARQPRITSEIARAHVAFRLGQYLIRRGGKEEGERWLDGLGGLDRAGDARAAACPGWSFPTRNLAQAAGGRQLRPIARAGGGAPSC